jgi:transcriptional regulator with XRE-family HTH domain
MHLNYLAGIERGIRTPSWDKFSDLAEALSVPVSTLVREAEEQRRDTALQATALSAYHAACDDGCRHDGRGR